MKKKYRNIAVTLLLFVGIGVILGFSRQKKSQTSCWSFAIEVNHDAGHFFVDENSIRQQLAETGTSVLGVPLTEIDLAAIRETIESEPSVASAKVFITADGKLKAQVEQRTPVLRIINKDGSGFYLDASGETFPLSDTYTAHIMVATGEVNEDLGVSVRQINKDAGLASSSSLPGLYALATTVDQSSFWSAQIDHIVVKANGDFELIPRVGNHRILLGDAERINEKLDKLRTFYAETIGTYDLNQYKQINLKYRDQVVCTRW